MVLRSLPTPNIDVSGHKILQPTLNIDLSGVRSLPTVNIDLSGVKVSATLNIDLLGVKVSGFEQERWQTSSPHSKG